MILIFTEKYISFGLVAQKCPDMVYLMIEFPFSYYFVVSSVLMQLIVDCSIEICVTVDIE